MNRTVLYKAMDNLQIITEMLVFSDKRGCFICHYFVCPNSLARSNIW